MQIYIYIFMIYYLQWEQGHPATDMTYLTQLVYRIK